jgi:hypothetical protein
MGLHHEVVTRIQLEDVSGKTRLTLTDGPYPEEGRRWAGARWNDAFDKLAVDLAATDGALDWERSSTLRGSR